METLSIGNPTATAENCIPRVGFLGVGWIGRHRMEAVARSGLAEVAAICDASDEAAAAAGGALETACRRAASLDELLDSGIDGVVIATPSAQHAEQATAALQRGIAVFCQKPLGRTAAETQRVVDTAREADRLLAVDFSYRHTATMRAIRSLIASGELGEVFAADLVFHNAYGPDKAWFYDRESSGGGCLIDLGTHLVDLALWCLGFPETVRVSPALFSHGRRLEPGTEEVEDFATATLDLAGGKRITIACSWKAHAGEDAVISAAFQGTSGGAVMRNVDGSFFDFVAERNRGTSRETIVRPPDEWGGRAINEWAKRLARGERFDPAEAGELVTVARTLDAIYGR